MLNLRKNQRKKIGLKHKKTHVPHSSKYITILDEITFSIWLEKLKKSNLFAFNLETDLLDILTSDIIGFSFAVFPGEAAYLPVAHNYLNAPKQLERNAVMAQLKPLLEDENLIKVGQNLKFSYSVLKKYHIKLGGIKFDTMLEAYMLNSVAGKHDINNLASRWLNHKTVAFTEISGKGKKKLTFNQIALVHAAHYSAENSDIALQLHLKMWPELEKESDLKRVFEEIEMPLLKVISRIECNGVLIDKSILEKHSQELTVRMNLLEKKAHELVGESFSLSSAKQLQTILFEKIGIKPIKRTPGGAPSTCEEVLSELALDYLLPKIILEYRSLFKLKTAYADKLSRMINPSTGRVHTSYQQAVTSTGRLSSTDPNLQSIPVRSEDGRRIRQAFIAPEGCYIVSADYSQIELRIMAHLSQDKGLLTAFSKGHDIHRVTAAKIFGVSVNKVTSEQRRRAKAINFGLIYGMSAFGLSRQLNVSTGKAKIYMDRYFERYPGVVSYMETIRQKASKKGYVSTLYGRRLWLPNIKSCNIILRKAAERAAINAPLQGTAADIIKRAMIDIDSWLRQEESLKIAMIIQVHDELVFEVCEEHIEFFTTKIRQIMENIMTLDVPLLVDVGIGNNWEQTH